MTDEQLEALIRYSLAEDESIELVTPAPAPRVPRVDPVTREVHYVSATQLKTFKLCKRKWWIESILDRREEESPAMRKGKRGHAEVERWYLEGRRPRHASILRALELGLLPERDAPGLLIEQPLGEVSVRLGPSDRRGFTGDPGPNLYAAGVPFVGFVDLLAPPLIVDHKFVSGDYDLSADELGHDTQMLTYGVWAAQRWALDAVQLRHVYYGTRDTSARRVDVEVPVDAARERWHNVAERSVEELKRTAAVRDLEDVPGPELGADGSLPSACRAYNRLCPWFEQCPIAKEMGMNLSEMLKRKAQGVTPSATPAPEAPTVSVVAPPAPAPEAPSATPEAPTVSVAAPVGIVPPDAPPAISAAPATAAISAAPATAPFYIRAATVRAASTKGKQTTEVSLSADIQPGSDPGDAVRQLLAQARALAAEDGA